MTSIWWADQYVIQVNEDHDKKLAKFGLSFTNLKEHEKQPRDGYKHYYSEDGKYLLLKYDTKEWFLAKDVKSIR